MSTSNVELAQLYALKGICNLNGEWMLSIRDVQNEHHQWMHPGQSLGSLKLLSYDSKSESAQLSYQDQTFSLRLAQNSHVPLSVVGSSTYPSDVLNRINKKTEAYRLGIQKLLKTPDSGARSQDAQEELERDLEVSVANYRQRLLAEYTEDANATNVLTNAQGASSGQRITGVKRQNRVNSRIWASDHIEKHGLPTQ